MVRVSTFALVASLVVVVCGTSLAWGNSPPVVSNVTAGQRAGSSQMVDVGYDLADADGDLCMVWIAVSDDGGTTWNVPVQNFSGDWGSGVLPGTSKVAVWDAGSDLPGRVGNFRVRVYADDGTGTPAKVVVPAGWFPYRNVTNAGAWSYVPTFLIDKYEITNAFYCQFLNNADPAGAYWPSGMTDIVRYGVAGNYYYAVTAGREDYPMRGVSALDASAFAQWRSQLEGITYRLPSEQEWEKAAAWDPIQRHYYAYGFHSDSIDPIWCNYGNSYGGTTPVGYFDGTNGRGDGKSFYGCYDMSGNVIEWTVGLWLKGGYWYLPSGPSECACIYRLGGYWEGGRQSYFGFRLVVGSN
jgi:hypothetical protein